MEAVVERSSQSKLNPKEPSARFLFGYVVILKITAIRIPCHNDLYIDKNGKIQRCKQFNYSRRVQKRYIVKEAECL